MKNTHECPFCPTAIAVLITEEETVMYKDNSVTIQHSFYECKNCSLTFDSEETLQDVLNQVYNKPQGIT